MHTDVQPQVTTGNNGELLAPPPIACYSDLELRTSLKHLDNGIDRTSVPPMERDLWVEEARSSIRKLRAAIDELLSWRTRSEHAGQKVSELTMKLEAFGAAGGIPPADVHDGSDSIRLELTAEGEASLSEQASHEDDEALGEIPPGTPLSPPVPLSLDEAKRAYAEQEREIKRLTDVLRQRSKQLNWYADAVQGLRLIRDHARLLTEHAWLPADHVTIHLRSISDVAQTTISKGCPF